MSGLNRLVKFYGRVTICGKKYSWDYAQDKAVPAEEMPHGSERHKLSERACWMNRSALICAARGCDGCEVCKPKQVTE